MDLPEGLCAGCETAIAFSPDLGWFHLVSYLKRNRCQHARPSQPLADRFAA